MGEDALLTLAFIKGCDRVISIEKCLYYYRPNLKSGTSNVKEKYLDDLAIFILHSFPYRRSEREIEMGIYSFVSTYLVFHSVFPAFDLQSMDHVKRVVEKILSFNFTTSPRFIRKHFISASEMNYPIIKDKFYTFLFKIMRSMRIRFNVSLIIE